LALPDGGDVCLLPAVIFVLAVAERGSATSLFELWVINKPTALPGPGYLADQAKRHLTG